METTENYTDQIHRLNDQIAALKKENDRLEYANSRLEDQVYELERDCTSYREQAESINRVAVLHDGIRELGFDIGVEDVPYAVTSTAYRMRLAAALRRAGYEAE